MSYSWLPKVLAEIAEVAGLDAALKLALRRGGTEIYVPGRAGDDHWLVETVGRDAADAICRYFAIRPPTDRGDGARYYRNASRGVLVEVPLGPRGSLAKIRGEVDRMIATGASASEIALACGFTERGVRKRRARARALGGDDRQGRLFSKGLSRNAFRGNSGKQCWQGRGDHRRTRSRPQMRTSEKGIAFVAAHEGVATRAYRDVGGVWTIGVGHTAAAGAPKPVSGMTITRTEAFAILARDLARFETRVNAALPEVSQTAFDGAASFDFNTGAIASASWVKNYRAGNMTAARASLMLWVKAAGRTVVGLVKRREDEARLIFNGDYGDVGGAAAPPAVNPSASAAADAIMAYQSQLAALGFYHNAVDGLAGPATKAAVLAYQRTHPDLVADGIVGPATRASLDRDMQAGAAPAAAGAVATAAAAGSAVVVAVADNGTGLAGKLVLGGVVVIAAIIIFVIVRNRIRKSTAAKRAKGD